MEAAQKSPAEKSSQFAEYDYSNFYYGAGDDPLNLLRPYADWYREARPNGYYLYQEALASAPTTRVRVKNGRTGQWQDLLNLASYNYLGISYRPEVKQAAIEAVEKYGLGASGSPILSGTFDVHEQFVQELARFKDKEACIVFPTGYSANVGFISALMRSGDTVFLDQYSHASIVDEAILAKAKTVFFRHNNPLDLERKIANVKGKKLVVVEGVYSMDGDICTLPEILEVTKRHGARMLIDEAHSTFLFGPNGRGVAEHFGLDKEVDFTSARSRRASAARRVRRRLARARRLRERVRPLAVLLLQPLAGAHRGPPGRPPDRRRRASAAGEAVEQLRVPAPSLRGGGRRHREVELAGHAGDGQQRREGVRGRGEDPGPRPLPEPGHVPGRPEAQVAPPHLGLGRPREQDLEQAVQTIAGVLREEGICR
ncbi:MAG: aminotransferase class I/II-fold pyridoxal phosphate-dependent enzyme [Vicinamibacteria bacterium]